MEITSSYHDDIRGKKIFKKLERRWDDNYDVNPDFVSEDLEKTEIILEDKEKEWELEVKQEVDTDGGNE